jgi:hypothetical protein
MSAPSDVPTKRPAIAQFSLGALFLAMTWAAMVCIALNTPSRLWSDAIGSISILALLTAILVVIYGQAKSRAFAVGFALFGCLYLLCLHRFDGFAPRLLARDSAESLFRIMHKEEWSPIATALAARTTAMQRLAEQRDRTVEIVQGASIMLVATLGGFLACYLSGLKRTAATTITK